MRLYVEPACRAGVTKGKGLYHRLCTVHVETVDHVKYKFLPHLLFNILAFQSWDLEMKWKFVLIGLAVTLAGSPYL